MRRMRCWSYMTFFNCLLFLLPIKFEVTDSTINYCCTRLIHNCSYSFAPPPRSTTASVFGLYLWVYKWSFLSPIKTWSIHHSLHPSFVSRWQIPVIYSLWTGRPQKISTPADRLQVYTSLLHSSLFLIAIILYIHYHLSSSGGIQSPPLSCVHCFLTSWRPQAAQTRWSLFFK